MQQVGSNGTTAVRINEWYRESCVTRVAMVKAWVHGKNVGPTVKAWAHGKNVGPTVKAWGL